jgi:hypothetical protein
MTIIACDGHTMVADSWCFHGDVGYPMPTPKIVRVPDGGIVGAAGFRAECDAIRSWASNGFRDADKPTLDREHDSTWLWLKPNGELWQACWDMKLYRLLPPFTVGVQEACLLAEGAMNCGVCIVAAVEMAISRCNSVGGPVTVLRLAP